MKLYHLFTLTIVGLAALTASAQPISGQGIPATDPNGAYCREYQQTVIVGGKPRKSYGTACMQPDGDWKILPSDVQEQVSDEAAIEYTEPPRYISKPVYVVPPTVFYEPYTYYNRYRHSYGDPYYGRSSISFGIDIGGGHRHGGHYRGHRGGYRSHGHR